MSLPVVQRPPFSHFLVTVLIALAISLPVAILISWLVNISSFPIPSFVFTGISSFIVGWRTSTVRTASWKRKQLRKQREEEDLRAGSSENGHYL